MLELRPHAVTYSIKSESDPAFPISDVYFIGMRVKRNVPITKNTIDLDGTR